jgi:hypothetical protein
MNICKRNLCNSTKIIIPCTSCKFYQKTNKLCLKKSEGVDAVSGKQLYFYANYSRNNNNLCTIDAKDFEYKNHNFHELSEKIIRNASLISGGGISMVISCMLFDNILWLICFGGGANLFGGGILLSVIDLISYKETPFFHKQKTNT